jgi:ABC-type dipeptide/oligopeptide/nickel transport system permease subunit
MRRFGLDAKGTIGLAIVALIVAAALLAPWLAPLDPNEQDLLNTLMPPAWNAQGTAEHVLGTDRLGQDILSRIVYGARVSLIVAVGAVSLSASLGTVLGMLAGFVGRAAGTIVMRAADIVLAIPFILLALVLMSVLGASLLNLVIAFVMVRWAQYARIAFALSLEIREREYIVACKACGVSLPRTLLRHILPNIASPLLVVSTLELAYAILMESGLSFLGLGAPPETPSWGGMLQEGRAEIDIAWWLTAFPGFAIMLTAIGFNFVGDWLRDRLDPRTQLAVR